MELIPTGPMKFIIRRCGTVTSAVGVGSGSEIVADSEIVNDPKIVASSKIVAGSKNVNDSKVAAGSDVVTGSFRNIKSGPIHVDVVKKAEVRMYVVLFDYL